MRNLKWCALPVCCLLSSFWIGVGSSTKAAEASSKEAVTSLLQLQNDAWNKGDLDTFMTGYLDSPDLSFTASGKEVWGYEALRDRYRTRYGQSKESMGRLSFSDVRVFDLGAANALAIGHWHLVRESSSEKLDGTFSLVLVRTDKGWKILHDHTSMLKAD
ncbi:MAG: nuclear transport factor 2 family protein [Candidatus Obscuribacterales bacterium]|nr:nuclear transport factor 2 family protein [Candidatus Obscuribacterales bacterium]